MACASSALIVGGGIAGLSLAIALSRVGVRCDVIDDGNPNLATTITIAGCALNALAELGLFDRVLVEASPVSHDAHATATLDAGGCVITENAAVADWLPVESAVEIELRSLIELMLKAAEALGAEILRGVTFGDGEKRTYDLLVGRPFQWNMVPDPWYRERALLIGDAAHAAALNIGLGVSLALQDAVVLAQCIHECVTVEDAFAAFMIQCFDRLATDVPPAGFRPANEQGGMRRSGTNTQLADRNPPTAPRQEP